MFGSFQISLRSSGASLLFALSSFLYWAPASAESQSPCCIGDTVSVQLAERRQLSGREFRRRVVGKLVHYKRQLPSKRGGTVKGALWGILRFDGSFWLKCEWYNAKLDQWYPCISLQPNNESTGFRNGTWVLKGDLVCISPSARNVSGEQCFTMYNVKGRLFVEKVSGSGPTSLPGYVELSPPRDLRQVGNVQGARSLKKVSQKLGVRLPVMSIIQKPGPDVPARYRSFVGVWAGNWGGYVQQKHVLIVERIRGHEALVIYAWGKYDGPSGKWGSGWVRTKALFKGDYLVVSRPKNKITAEYKLTTDGKIEHRIEKRRPKLIVSTAIMTRVPLN